MRSMNVTHFLPHWLSLGHSFLIWLNYPISCLWHSVSHSVRCASYLSALCHKLAFSCVCVHSCQVDWMLCFLYCLSLIWNSNIASLLSLNNIDFHLHSPEAPGIYLGQDCVSFFPTQFVLQHLEFFWTADAVGCSKIRIRIRKLLFKLENNNNPAAFRCKYFRWGCWILLSRNNLTLQCDIRPLDGALDKVSAAAQSGWTSAVTDRKHNAHMYVSEQIYKNDFGKPPLINPIV